MLIASFFINCILSLAKPLDPARDIQPSLPMHRLQHNQPNPPNMLLILTRLVPCIDAAAQRSSAVVVQVVVQLTVAGAEFLLFEEVGVVEEGEGIEDVEFLLHRESVNHSQKTLSKTEEYEEWKSKVIDGGVKIRDKHTLFAKINVSCITSFNLFFNAALSPLNATSDA